MSPLRRPARRSSLSALGAARALDALHTFQSLGASLGLARVLPGHVAADVFFLFGDDLHLSLVLDLLMRLSLGADGGVLRIVARIRFQLAGVQFPHGLRHRVEKVPVVRDDDDGAGKIGQRGFEPLDGFNVQVIGRLVEQQQARLLQHELGQVARASFARRKVD